jgi:hypothetical protein
VAAYIGYDISITEYRPFMVGLDAVGDNRVIGTGSLMVNEWDQPIRNTDGRLIQAGDYSEYPYMLGPPENRYYWTVHVHQASLTWFRCGNGGGQTGVDPMLLIGIANDLECILRRWKPAHTQLIFDYSGQLPDDPYAGTGGDLEGELELPANRFVAEDGVTTLVAEDGVSYYVQET